MSTIEKYLIHRGDLRGLAVVGRQLAFVTAHRERLPTAFYWLDVEKMDLTQVPLEVGGLCVVSDGATCWFSGTDARLYKIASKPKAPQALESLGDRRATRLVLLAGDQLGALCGSQVLVVDRAKGKIQQTLELTDKGTSLAADPTGQWMVAGTSKGTVSVFECEANPGVFQPAQSAKLHEGAVTALLFEPEELRFLSAGADQKLLLTHARGKLEPEDRGRDASHKDQVTAIVHAPGERFITGGRDKALKTWTRAGATRPATLAEGVPEVVDLAIVDIHDRPHLVVAGSDNALRFVLIDAGGKFDAITHRFYDAYDRADHLLGQNDAALQGEALHALAEYDDQRSLEKLAGWIGPKLDHALRLKATELLARSKHARAAKLLEPLLGHDDSAVRLAAFAGLRGFAGKDSLRPLELALKTKKADVGVAAVTALEPLAKKDEQARQLLIKTLSGDPEEVRRAALLSLENVFPKGSPEPTLIAMQSEQADTRRLAVVRCLQRNLLGDPRIAGAVRRRSEDASPDVRRTAFLVSLLSRKKLAQAVRERDKELHRQLFELETFEVEPKKGGPKELPAVAPAKIKLEPADYEPLLSAMSSRMVDASLLGARCLALLGDPRAFGLLLQLSRENDAASRTQVCQALAALADARALQRLETLINDSAAEVRDAAYTALSAIREGTPLESAAAGLASQHADVRRRGLQTLASTLRKTKGEAPAAARSLLLLALNDGDTNVRGEAFKAAVNLNIAGDNVATLRFVLQSVHHSVRREVLTEAMAQDSQPWAWQLLLELLDDPDRQVRTDAYEHLLKKSKARDVAPMQSALKSRYPDIRKRAVDSLIKLKTDAAQEALVAAIDDDEKDVRTEALKALITAEAESVLRQAMQSRHVDVRLQAASARAFYSDPAARDPLLNAAVEPRPEKDADQQLWQKTVPLALWGLGVLGDPEVVPRLLPLLTYREADIRKRAADALIWCMRPAHVDSLKGSLQHSDAEVSYRIALALALCGEGIAAPLVFSEPAAKVLDEKERLIAAAAYDSALGETRLAERLDSETPWVRQAALLVLLFRDWRIHQGAPARLLTALAAQHPRIRLAAAHAIEAFAKPDDFATCILTLLNDRGTSKAWTISAETLADLANLIVFGSPQCRAKSIALFESLAEEKQESWDFHWRMHALRFKDEVAAARAKSSVKPPPCATPPEELAQLAFGTFVGLVREQGSYHDKGGKPSFDAPVLSIRQAAIRRLVKWGQVDAAVRAASVPILVQSLGDPLADVRMTAFQGLAESGVEPAERAAVALECGHDDLAVQGLRLLTEGAGAKANAILAEVITSRNDSLAMEASRLLMEAAGPAKAAESMLESPHRDTRQWGLASLANAADKDNAARKQLQGALESRYLDVRKSAALRLAALKDASALESLKKLLFEPEVKLLEIVQAFVALGDPKAGDVLLDRIDSSLTAAAGESANSGAMFEAVAQFRNPANVPRLLAMLDRKEWCEWAAQAVFKISGHDQPIEDPNDDLPDRKWMEKQHPRHDQVLASLLERAIEIGWKKIGNVPVAPGARWSLTNACDPMLGIFAADADETLRHGIVQVIGWRVKHRKSSPQPLLAALEHRDPTTKFFAAEGLANAGRNEGLSVLLSAVELLSDLNLRRRAVLALGELGDVRSLEVLLKLASDDTHALQDSAAEAIGHLGKSDKAGDIQDLLLRLAASTGSAGPRAIVGLRWLDTPKGWTLLREQAAEGRPYLHVIVEQLGYNNDPATRDLLLKLLRESHQIIRYAFVAARRLFGPDSLEPDYSALQSANPWVAQNQLGDLLVDSLKRVCERGDPARIFEILPKAGQNFDTLAVSLANRSPLPESAAAAALENVHPATVEVAASVLGRSTGKTHGKAVSAALLKWQDEWSRLHQAKQRSGDDDEDDEHLAKCQKALERLCWAAGRLGAAKAELLTLVDSHRDAPDFAPVRRAALAALGEQKLAKTELAAMERTLDDADASLRRQAAEILAAQDSAGASKLAEKILSDRPVFQQLAGSPGVSVQKALAAGAVHTHYQPVVLPFLLAAADVKTLVDAATNKDLNDVTRLGAIEGLARLPGAKSEECLAGIGKNEANDEELRKAAWRGLRRLKRSVAASPPQPRKSGSKKAGSS